VADGVCSNGKFFNASNASSTPTSPSFTRPNNPRNAAGAKPNQGGTRKQFVPLVADFEIFLNFGLGFDGRGAMRGHVAEGGDAARYRFEEGGRLRVVSEADETVYQRVEQWAPSGTEIAAFAGEYVSDEAEVTLTVAPEDGKLVLRRRPGTKIPLSPAYRDGFQAAGLGSVRFLRDRSGKVTELSVGEARVWDLRFRKQ